MASTISYTKTEKVQIDLTEGDLKQAVKVYLSGRLDIPDNAEFTFEVSYDTFDKLTVSWSEGPETITEEIE